MNTLKIRSELTYCNGASTPDGKLPFVTEYFGHTPIWFLIDTGRNKFLLSFTDNQQITHALTSVQKVKDVTFREFSGNNDDIMWATITAKVDFQSLVLEVPFYITKNTVNLPGSILGFDFFISHYCNFNWYKVTGDYVMTILNECQEIPLEFRELQDISTNIAQSSNPDTEIKIEDDKQLTSNIDCIPLKHQIIPSPLLFKIFGSTEKAHEKITRYCNVININSKKVDNIQLPDNEIVPDRVNLYRLSITRWKCDFKWKIPRGLCGQEITFT